MAFIDITFACGCGTQSVDVDKVTSPVCLSCGASGILRANAPAPRFRGCVTGPHAQTVALPAIAVDLTAKDATPLPLKRPEPEGVQ